MDEKTVAQVEAWRASLQAGDVLVTETGAGLFTQVMLDDTHAVMADEPKARGGDDLGPSPYGLLLMSLGACTSMTLRLYADRKQWPMERVVVRLRHTKTHEIDAERPEAADSYLDRIDRSLEFIGPLDEEQLTRLMEIADKCPVHRTLTGRIQINTRMRSNEIR